MFLLDTVTVSDMFKKQRNQGVMSWLSSKKQTELYISVITLGEIQRGISLQESKSPLFAFRLQEWLDSIENLYGKNILPVSPEIAHLWGKISAKIGNSDMDNLIAATALHYNLTVVTRNIRHFEQTGATCYNPWIQ